MDMWYQSSKPGKGRDDAGGCVHSVSKKQVEETKLLGEDGARKFGFCTHSQ